MGYWAAWFGKNHNVPTWEASQAGPFHNWPQGMGFDYFCGFIGGDTSQLQTPAPEIFFLTSARRCGYCGSSGSLSGRVPES